MSGPGLIECYVVRFARDRAGRDRIRLARALLRDDGAGDSYAIEEITPLIGRWHHHGRIDDAEVADDLAEATALAVRTIGAEATRQADAGAERIARAERLRALAADVPGAFACAAGAEE